MRSSSFSDQSSETETADIQHLLTVLWRGRRVIAISTIVVTLLVLAFVVVREPQYSATAQVLIDPNNERVIDLQAALQNRPINEALIESEIGVISSSAVLRTVIETLKLDQDAEFVPSLVPFSERSLTSRLTIVARAVFGGIKSLFGGGGGDDGTGTEAVTDPGGVPAWRIALGGLAQSVSARQVGSSYVIAIQVETASPTKSALIANSIVDQYIALARTSKREAASNTIRWLTGEVVDLENQVKVSADAVDAFRVQNGLTSREQVESTSLQLEQLRQSLREAEAALATLQGLAAPGQPAANAAPANGRAVPASAASARERERNLLNRIETLRGSVADAEARLTVLTSAWATFDQLERQAVADQRLYERFLDQMKTVDALENFQQVDARVVSPALPPLRPSDPSARLLLMMGLVLGAGIGVAVVGAREMLRRSFHSRDEVERFTGLPVAAVFPMVEATTDPRALIQSIQRNPNTEFAEGLRKLRSSVLRGKTVHGQRIIMMTSSLPSEGKSSVTFMLAWSLLKANSKAVVLNLDLHRSPYGKSVDGRDPRYVDAVFPGKTDRRFAVVRDEIFNVPVLSFGRTDTLPADFLASVNLHAIVSRLASLYDFVLIDTPPLGPVSDVAAFASLVDTALFVIDWQQTSRPIIAEGLRQLERLDVKVAGTVLTKVDTRIEAQFRALPYEQYANYPANSSSSTPTS